MTLPIDIPQNGSSTQTSSLSSSQNCTSTAVPNRLQVQTNDNRLGSGLSANGTGTPYTIPTLRFSPSLVIMDSKKIAAELEKQHPQPSMHLDSPVIADVEEAIFKVMMPLIPVLRPQIPRNLLNPRSVEYFERTRAARFGMPLSELEKVKGGEPAWQAAEQPIKDMAALLKRQGGPYILGKTRESSCSPSTDRFTDTSAFAASYADFMVVSMLEFVRRINEKDFDRMVGVDAAFKEQFKACEKWLAKDQ